MNISQFVKQQNTTVDTIKHYLKLELLTPQKKQSWYNFTEQEAADFQNIQALKKLGFPLALIKKLKESHEKYCGTPQQWQQNLVIIEEALVQVAIEKADLQIREDNLLQTKAQLLEKLAE
ncbi:MerR family transcriptional regulator [Enterococcus sp. HY326]|uniref:MerR family transcriptional regulator n=1 Tax=Enterococcus sp. HY326 TaxID=2971265 RepID=UPI00223F6EFF|nr:MerR family transcriptional regulator [Enterococcus sp. HY326]